MVVAWQFIARNARKKGPVPSGRYDFRLADRTLLFALEKLPPFLDHTVPMGRDRITSVSWQ